MAIAIPFAIGDMSANSNETHLYGQLKQHKLYLTVIRSFICIATNIKSVRVAQLKRVIRSHQMSWDQSYCITPTGHSSLMSARARSILAARPQLARKCSKSHMEAFFTHSDKSARKLVRIVTVLQ